MKKSLLSVFLTVILLAAGAAYEQDFVSRQFREFAVHVSVLKDKAEAGASTTDDFLGLQKDWEDKKKYLHIFIPHNEIKEIGLWISEAVSFSDYDDEKELVDKLRVLYDLSVQIPETFKVKWENIL